MRAAQTIFVRDGYEGAELGEIAALAGRTKGAIYAHFKSKEDVFLALVENRTLYHRAQMEAALAKSTSVEENVAAFRAMMLSLTRDKSWALLMLEFKLFAIRHPESAERLQSYWSTILHDEEHYSALLGPAGAGKHAVSRVVAIKTLQPMFSALLLEAAIDPALEEQMLARVAGRVFDAMLRS
jgi:AcrR family transcriptional regulator